MSISLASFVDELAKIAEEAPAKKEEKEEGWKFPTAEEWKVMLKGSLAGGLGGGLGAAAGFALAPKVIPKLYERMDPVKFGLLMGAGSGLSGLLSSMAVNAMLVESDKVRRKAEEARERAKAERNS
jgi:hypothetical protein